MREVLSVSTSQQEKLVDITGRVQEAVAQSLVAKNIAVLYVQGPQQR